MRRMLAIVVCKLLRFAGKLLGRGSSLPGQFALKVCPDVLGRVKLPPHIIAVTGSNGKTSTVEMIAAILAADGRQVVYNKEGSNQIEGVATLILSHCTLGGKMKGDVLLLESDERYARYTFRWFHPTHFVITNLYRDQLTRNGHPQWVYESIRPAIHPEETLVLNADDPLVACFARGHDSEKVKWFGLEECPVSTKEHHGVYDDGLRCPVCGGALMPLGTSLRCPQGHSYDMAKEGYVNLLAIQRRHAADPGDGKAMVRARRAFLQAGYYAPFQKALAELCLEYAPECGETHLLDAGCGEGSYDRVVYDAFAAQGRPCVLAGFDLSKDAIRLAAKLLPEAAFAVGGSFSAPVRDGWADVLLNIFSPFAGQEFCRVLRSGGVLLYAVPTARHLYGLKEVLYDEPYENAEQQTEYSGFTLIGERTVTDTITVEGDQIRNLFAMTPYFWKTPHVGALRLAAKQSLTTEIGFRFLAYRRV